MPRSYLSPADWRGFFCVFFGETDDDIKTVVIPAKAHYCPEYFHQNSPGCFA
jgi:hypothetical protein